MSQPDAQTPDELLAQVQILQKLTKGLLAAAMQGEDGDPKVALAAIQQASRLLRQQVDLEERVHRLRSARAFDQSEELKRKVESALARFPAARRAVSRALAGQSESEP